MSIVITLVILSIYLLAILLAAIYFDVKDKQQQYNQHKTEAQKQIDNPAKLTEHKIDLDHKD